MKRILQFKICILNTVLLKISYSHSKYTVYLPRTRHCTRSWQQSRNWNSRGLCSEPRLMGWGDIHHTNTWIVTALSATKSTGYPESKAERLTEVVWSEMTGEIKLQLRPNEWLKWEERKGREFSEVTELRSRRGGRERVHWTLPERQQGSELWVSRRAEYSGVGR